MPSVCSIDPRARETLLRELKQLASRLRSELAVEAVYVFGSFARDEAHEGSDIDLLVVGNVPGRAPDRVGAILRRTRLPVEPIVVRAATLAARLRQRHPLYVRAMAEAVRLD